MFIVLPDSNLMSDKIEDKFLFVLHLVTVLTLSSRANLVVSELNACMLETAQK